MIDNPGWMEVTFRVPCDLSEVNPTQTWIAALLRQNPDLTGWPFFVDLWTPRHPEFRPAIRDGIWEAKIFQELDGYDGGKDFWRIDAKRGLFFAARALEDDTSPRSRNPGKTVEFALVVLRVAELISIAHAFASYLCEDGSESAEPVAMKWEWTGLENRVLSSWASPERGLYENHKSHTNTVTTSIALPLPSSMDQVALLTEQVVRPFFLCFDGWVCPAATINDLVQRLVSRRL